MSSPSNLGPNDLIMLPWAVHPANPAYRIASSFNYTEQNIKADKGLQIIRRSPTLFIPDRERAGMIHLATEVIDNCIDEIQLKGAEGRLIITMCVDKARNTFQLIIIDNGRGVPLGSVWELFTQPHSSGKYDTDAYATSGGQFGVGAKATSGLSQFFRVTSQREDGTGSLYIQLGQHVDEETYRASIDRASTNLATGTTVVFEPDPGTFLEIDDFAEVGYIDLLTLLKRRIVFTDYNIEFRITQTAFPQAAWTAPTAEHLQAVIDAVQGGEVVFSSAAFDRLAWLRGFWDVHRPFLWAHELAGQTRCFDPEKNKDVFLGYQIKLFFAPKEPGGRFGMINSIPIDAPTSNHLSEIQKTLTRFLSDRIQRPEVRAFFLTLYKLPLYIAADVRFEGARMSNATKTAFYYAPFREAYGTHLAMHFATAEGADALDQLYALLAEDIDAKYLASVTGVVKVKNAGRLLDLLNFPDRFFDCNGEDRSATELFLVEGASAGGGKGRNIQTMGIYMLGGKPLNGIQSSQHQRESQIAIQKDPIYQDFFRIIGFDPARPDLSNLYYGSCILMTDADFHGEHIAALVLSNAMMVAPQLIDSGFFHVISPPYYELQYAARRGGKGAVPKVWLRDAKAVGDWMARVVYREALDIHITSPGVFDQPRQLNGDEFAGFIKMLLHVGEEIENLAAELVLPELVVEGLTTITQYLERGNVNKAAIQATLGADAVDYRADSHILTVAIGRDDYVIPLQDVREKIYQRVLPLLRRMAWNRISLFVSGRHKGAGEGGLVDNPRVQMREMSLIQLYLYLKTFDDLFKIRIFKGLGGMLPEDKFATCMDPRHRSTEQIVGVKDAKRVMDLLGKRDSEPRKQLLVGRTIS